MGRPLVSVIIPTYNREKYVVKAIDSVLSQAFKDYEIIVVNDGSTDGTKDNLKSYGDKIKYIYQDNSGVSAARNEGIRRAKGEWVAFLDSDDEWLPDYLLQHMERLMLLPHVYTSMMNSIEVSIDGKKVNIFEQKKLLNKFKENDYLTISKPLRFVIKHHLTTLPTIVMKREILLKAGLFDTRLTIAEDLDLIARMAIQGSLGICKQPMYIIYRRDESTDSLAKQLFDKGILSRKSFDIVYEKLINDENLTRLEKLTVNRVRSSNKRSIANLLLRSGEKYKARAYFKEAARIYPSIASLLKYLLSFLPTNIALSFILKGKQVKP